MKFWENLEKLHNAQSAIETLQKFFTGLQNGAEKINLVKPVEEKKALDASRNVIGRVVAMGSSQFPKFIDYYIEARKPPILISGVHRRTHWGDEDLIEAIKKMAIFRDQIEESDVSDYELRVVQILEWLEQILEDNVDPTTGVVDYTWIDSVVDAAIPDRLHDTARDAFNWFGFYVPWLFDKVADDVLIPQLKKLQPKIQAWATAQRMQRAKRLTARKNFWRRNLWPLIIIGTIFIVSIILMLKF